MKNKSCLFVFALSLLLLGSISCSSNKPRIDDEVAVLDTTYGRIVIEFAVNVAPKHVDNFKTLVRQGFYDHTKFFRIIKIKNKLVGVQGGDPNTINGAPATWGQGQPGQKTVPAEFSKLKHERGIVSAFHKPNDPNSATSQFFICVAAEPSFDGQFSIFGRVIDGMSVVDTIARAPVDAQGERPTDPVVVNQIHIVKRDEVK